MPEVSLTSKMAREPDEEGKEIKKKKVEYSNEEELNSCIVHLGDIVAEIEEGEFKNIREVLGIPVTEHIEHALGMMIALAGSATKRPSILSTS